MIDFASKLPRVEDTPTRPNRTRRVAEAISRRSLFVLGLIAAALISLLYLNQTSDLASTGYDVADLQAQQQLWQMRNDQLRLSIAQLESLDRIDREATTRLKMGPPQQQVYVTAPLVVVPTPVLLATPIGGSTSSPQGASATSALTPQPTAAASGGQP